MQKKDVVKFATGAAAALLLAVSSTSAFSAFQDTSSFAPEPVERPNIIVVMADDQDVRSLYMDQNGNSNMPYLNSLPEGRLADLHAGICE